MRGDPYRESDKHYKDILIQRGIDYDYVDSTEGRKLYFLQRLVAEMMVLNDRMARIEKILIGQEKS